MEKKDCLNPYSNGRYSESGSGDAYADYYH